LNGSRKTYLEVSFVLEMLSALIYFSRSYPACYWNNSRYTRGLRY